MPTPKWVVFGHHFTAGFIGKFMVFSVARLVFGFWPQPILTLLR